MNDAERARLKQCLEEEVRNCSAEIVRLEASLIPVAVDSAVGRLSRMDTLMNQGVGQLSLGKARRRLLLLRQALDSTDQPGFGECTLCGDTIPLRRMLLVPETRLCVECAED